MKRYFLLVHSNCYYAIFVNVVSSHVRVNFDSFGNMEKLQFEIENASCLVFYLTVSFMKVKHGYVNITNVVIGKVFFFNEQTYTVRF